MESRTAIPPPVEATSTHAPLPSLRVDLRQVGPGWVNCAAFEEEKVHR